MTKTLRLLSSASLLMIGVVALPALAQTPYPADYDTVAKKWFDETLLDPYSAHVELVRGPLLYPEPGPVVCMPIVLKWLKADREK